MTPRAWSHSALEAFENCPKQYYETKIEKRWPYEETDDMRWGKEVHKAFENFLLYDVPLPASMATHVEYLNWLKNLPGRLAGEEKLALDRHLQPCAYFGKDVWYRGQVDARKRDGSYVLIVDHKTGKVKNNFDQLKTFAIHEFLTNAEAMEIRAEYYWTQTKSPKGETYVRDQLWDLVRQFTPRLHRFADAFETGVFNPKPSGLCHGWCPVTDCEHWKPKKKRG